MAEEFKQRPNSGALFTNKDKKAEKQPDFKGRILIGSDLLDAIETTFKELDRRGLGALLKSDPRSLVQSSAAPREPNEANRPNEAA